MPRPKENKRMEDGFWAIPKAILRIEGLSLEHKMVYGILYTRMNGDNIAWPGQDYIADKIGVSVRSVQRYLIDLSKKGLIKVDRTGKQKTNRYHLTDNVIRQTVASHRGGDTTPVSCRDTTPVSPHTLYTREENEEKSLNTATPSVAGDLSADGQEVNKIMEAFQMKLNPTINYGNKTQRNAARDLIKVMGGIEKVLNSINYASKVQGERFAPIITTPYQLKEKLANLIAFHNREENKSPNVVSI